MTKKQKKKPLTQADILRSIKSPDDLIPHFEVIAKMCKAMGQDPEPYMHKFATKWMVFKENGNDDSEGEGRKAKEKKSKRNRKK